jgi:hypothetical protein
MASMTIVLTSAADGSVTMTSAEVANSGYKSDGPASLETLISIIRGLIPQVLTSVR